MRKKTAVVLAGSRFDADPRHTYWAESLVKAGYAVMELEVVNSPTHWRHISDIQVVGNRISVFSAHPSTHRYENAKLRPDQIQPETTTGHFIRQSVDHVVRSVSSVSDLIQDVDLLIINDLPALAAYASLTLRCKPFTIYDAQEIFVDSYDLLGTQKLSASEREHWIEIETIGVKQADIVVTVSPGIAKLYKERHGCEAIAIPNFLPCDRFLHRVTTKFDPHPVRFVFIGRADPYRGLEELLDQWDIDPALATMDLIIPVSAYQRKLLKQWQTKRGNRKREGISFRAAVPPLQIVPTLLEYDVGIIPYNYPYPYSHCSPNKFGEYVAANLPIIANSQPFVQETIESLEIGACFNWSDNTSFKQSVFMVSDPSTLSQLRDTVDRVRVESLSWDSYLARSNLESVIENVGRTSHTKSGALTITSAVKVDKSLIRPLIRHILRLSISLLKSNAQVLERPLRRLIHAPLIGKRIQGWL